MHPRPGARRSAPSPAGRLPPIAAFFLNAVPPRGSLADEAADAVQGIGAGVVWENKPVSEFIRAAIAVRAETGFCKAAREGDQRPSVSGGRV